MLLSVRWYNGPNFIQFPTHEIKRGIEIATSFCRMQPIVFLVNMSGHIMSKWPNGEPRLKVRTGRLFSYFYKIPFSPFIQSFKT